MRFVRIEVIIFYGLQYFLVTDLRYYRYLKSNSYSMESTVKVFEERWLMLHPRETLGQLGSRSRCKTDSKKRNNWIL